MISMISGGFDPLHVGHLDLIDTARRYGDVWVALNSDDWLIRKKGYFFMTFADRKRVMEALHHISGVIAAEDDDDTICATLNLLQPDYFVNGGDRRIPHEQESVVCKDLQIIQIFGGAKVQSSSLLVGAIL